jgi:PAS domain-containing protein
MEIERSYQANLDRYRKMFDQVEDGLAEIDLKGNITFVNNGVAKIWEGSVELETGLNYRSCLDIELKPRRG